MVRIYYCKFLMKTLKEHRKGLLCFAFIASCSTTAIPFSPSKIMVTILDFGPTFRCRASHFQECNYSLQP